MRARFFNIRNIRFCDDDPGYPEISLDVEVTKDDGERICEEIQIGPNDWYSVSDEFKDAINEHTHDDYDDASDSLNEIFEKMASFLQNIALTEDEINRIYDEGPGIENERDR